MLACAYFLIYRQKTTAPKQPVCPNALFSGLMDFSTVEILDVVSKTIGRALPTHQLNMMEINNSNNAQTIPKGPARSQKAKNNPKKQKLFRNKANYLIDWLEA